MNTAGGPTAPGDSQIFGSKMFISINGVCLHGRTIDSVRPPPPFPPPACDAARPCTCNRPDAVLWLSEQMELITSETMTPARWELGYLRLHLASGLAVSWPERLALTDALGFSLDFTNVGLNITALGCNLWKITGSNPREGQSCIDTKQCVYLENKPVYIEANIAEAEA
ncbi:hypothetical protein J6590_047540 [Homalodisca vitripennis]|nr:hypothetical protein J6590_047540 [Homalodisca vitripennis]